MPDGYLNDESERLMQQTTEADTEPSMRTLILANNGTRAAWLQAGALGLLLSIWFLVIYSSGGHVPFALYHPLFISVGLFFLLQGLLVLQPTSTPSAKRVGLVAHQLLIFVLGLPLISIGVWIMWHAHSKPGAKHFISLHGILGGVLFVLLWIQALFGLSTVYSGGQLYGSMSRAKGLWKYHRCVEYVNTFSISGYAIAVLLASEIMLALWNTTWGQKVTSTPAAMLLSFVVFGVGYKVARRVQVTKLGMTQAGP
ncbi:hypothetical protein MPSI1_001009 [Malassezia psittaci]|uniref:Cytochrome b561 domain-containing protein n=1 Tax=Malassezia psittaci TaxID=1821823 RepID=A0AAF0FCQ7_9BASI|nr:hypothetical protein MPSI1_001009 [Malassezia psittaci]